MFIFQNPGLRVFLVSGSPKDIRTLYVAINHRIGKLWSEYYLPTGIKHIRYVFQVFFHVSRNLTLSDFPKQIYKYMYLVHMY